MDLTGIYISIYRTPTYNRTTVYIVCKYILVFCYFMCAHEGLVERTVAESIGVTFEKTDLYFVALPSQKSLKHTQYEVLQT